MCASIRNVESNSRGYNRLFPTVFDLAKGSELWDAEGRRFIDFFCGAGTLNYGHNNELSKRALLEHIERDAIQNSFDSATTAQLDFVEAFRSIILEPRGLDYKIQLTGPTGTDAIEAALALARKTTSRTHVIAFTHAHHGQALGSLALTANRYCHREHSTSGNNVSHLPYDDYAPGVDSAALLKQMLLDPSSGLPMPAAVILETVQGEGGVNVASELWLNQIAEICSEHRIVLIVDDLQVGNGRTGTFFSFEKAGIIPDMVCLSESMGGGLPMSLLLVRPEYETTWRDESAFALRGHNLAFVPARASLEYWRDAELSKHIELLRQHTLARLAQLVEACPAQRLQLRGRGLVQAIDFGNGEKTRAIVESCFHAGLLVAPSGANAEVLKIMPALTTPLNTLIEGLDILDDCVHTVLDAPEAEREADPTNAVFPPIEICASNFRLSSSN